jgi:hypothetical protein
MRTYERPTLTKTGAFKKVTGLGGSGPRDVAFRHKSFCARDSRTECPVPARLATIKHRPVRPGPGLSVGGPAAGLRGPLRPNLR